MILFLVLINVLLAVLNFCLANGELGFSFYAGVFNLCAASFILGLYVRDKM